MNTIETPRVFDLAVDRSAMTAHFRARGGGVVDAIAPTVVSTLPRWVDEIASVPDGHAGVLQHFELGENGPQLCRSEKFVPSHDGFRNLFCDGALLDVASALLGEPAVLYKEKINYK